MKCSAFSKANRSRAASLSTAGVGWQYRTRQALIASLLLLPGLAAAQLGPEFVVNSTTAGNQTDPAVAADPAGNFNVAWVGPDGAGTGIFLRRFNADGSPRGAETRVNPDIAGDQTEPSVAIDGSGRFVVSYTASDADGTGIYARRYAATGRAIDSRPFRVNVKTAGFQSESKVAVSSDGSLAVAWLRSSPVAYAVQYRLYGENGKALTGDVTVDFKPTEDEFGFYAGELQDVSLARLGDGRFAVAYTDCQCADEFGGSVVKAFSNTGTLLGEHDGSRLSNAISASGTGYVVVSDSGLDGFFEVDVFATRLDGNGSAVSSNLLVSEEQFDDGNDYHADVAGTPSGQFVVVANTFEGYDIDRNMSIQSVSGRRYGGANVALTPYAQISSPGTRSRNAPRVALGNNGNGVAVWIDGGVGDHGLDGDAGGIVARRLIFSR